MLIQKINRHDCHEEFAYEDNGDWKAAAAVDGGKWKMLIYSILYIGYWSSEQNILHSSAVREPGYLDNIYVDNIHLDFINLDNI